MFRPPNMPREDRALLPADLHRMAGELHRDRESCRFGGVLSSASPIKAVDWPSRTFLEPRYLRLGIVGLVAAVRLGAGQQSLAAGSTSPCSSIKSRAKRMRASHCRQTTPRYHRLSTDRGCGIVVSTIARRLLPSLPSPTSTVAPAPSVARSHRASLIYGK